MPKRWTRLRRGAIEVARLVRILCQHRCTGTPRSETGPLGPFSSFEDGVPNAGQSHALPATGESAKPPSHRGLSIPKAGLVAHWATSQGSSWADSESKRTMLFRIQVSLFGSRLRPGQVEARSVPEPS